MILAMLEKRVDFKTIAEMETDEEKAKALEALVPGLKLEVAEEITIKFQ